MGLVMGRFFRQRAAVRARRGAISRGRRQMDAVENEWMPAATAAGIHSFFV